MNNTQFRQSFNSKQASDVRLFKVRSRQEVLEFKGFTFDAKIHKGTTRFLLHNLSSFNQTPSLTSLACGKTHTSGSWTCVTSYITSILESGFETRC